MSATITTVRSDFITTTEVHRRRARRRLSTPGTKQPVRLPVCKPLPHSIQALDLSSASSTQTLASLRLLVLSYLADLEQSLSALESPKLETWKAKGELTIDEARQWARTALEMLESIRSDVCYQLPEFHLADMSVESFVKSHLPDLHDVPGLNEMRSHLPDMADMRAHLPDMPHLPDMTDVRSHFPDFHLSDMRSKFDDVRTRFHDLDFNRPLRYIPTLSVNLQNLQQHLLSLDLQTGLDMSSLTPSSMISDILEVLLTSELITDLLTSNPDVREGVDMLERAARDVNNAVKQSFNGVRLINYSDLPCQWRNNPFVIQGYRFIPIERWPLIILSIFTFHNETLNIHTHLIPFILWGLNFMQLINGDHEIDTPEMLFMGFALSCLLCSAVWHTMSGCAHRASMDLCARVDYVGIGWLISASVGTVVYYGFQCHPTLGHLFLSVCFLTGLAGNILPFMDWFNQFEYRFYRIAFFLSLAFSAVAPLAGLAIMHSLRETLYFIAPVVPSLVSYIVGLVFYATHFPERVLSESMRKRLDCIGGGSHCLWHCFIVLAVSQHKAAILLMKEGVNCLAHY